MKSPVVLTCTAGQLVPRRIRRYIIPFLLSGKWMSCRGWDISYHACEAVLGFSTCNMYLGTENASEYVFWRHVPVAQFSTVRLLISILTILNSWPRGLSKLVW